MLEFKPKKIYYDVNIDKKGLTSKANNIITKYPHAEVIKVPSHWNIKEISELPEEEWIKSKRSILVLGIKKEITIEVNGRSTDFMLPSHANGCLSSCSYCYVQRRKKGANPLTIFLNTEDILEKLKTHAKYIGKRTTSGQTDAALWTYEIGNNNDCSLDVEISNSPIEIIEEVRNIENAKICFATKTVNDRAWLSVDPKGHTRIRYSLMPQKISTIVDVGTSKISDRIKSINNLVEHGYEVHLNLSPIIVYDNWENDWRELLQEVNDTLTQKAKNQLKAEIIFLTHSSAAHKTNLNWHPNAERYIWTPENQQTKFNKPDVICYKYDLKNNYVETIKRLVKENIPYCTIRYAF